MIKKLNNCWSNNDLIKFSDIYETNKIFLDNFFIHYYNIMNGQTKIFKHDYQVIENDFLKILIKLEDEYTVIKYMKKHNLDYKKILKNIGY